jgi:4-amino-4-deoxy-L-arabinose transferase-like glycosyltransferase
VQRLKITVIGLLLCLGFGLRLWGLADHNIWFDEGFSLWMSRQPAAQLMDLTARDTHPPLYYFVLQGWRSIAGEGEFAWRFPSVLAGILSVAAAYALGREVGGDLAGLAGMLLLSLAPMPVAFSQETRMYSLAVMLGQVALTAAVKLWRTGSWRSWCIYVVSLAGALNTLYLMAAVPVVTNLAFGLLWWRRGRPRRLLAQWLGAQLAAALLCLPWLLYVWPRFQSVWMVDQPVSVLFALQLYATALVTGASTNIGTYLVPVLAVLAVLAAGIAAIRLRARKLEQQVGLALLLLGLIVPGLIVLAMALPLLPGLGRPLAVRYFVALAPCFSILLGWGLAGLWHWKRPAGFVGAGVVVAVLLWSLAVFNLGRIRSDDYLSIASLLASHRQPGDDVVLFTGRDWPTFEAHYAGKYQDIDGGPTWDAAAAEARLAPLWERSDAVWLVLTPDALQADPNLVVKQWFASRAAATATWDFGANVLAVYARTPERARTLYDLGPEAVLPAGPSAVLADGARLQGVWWPLTRYVAGDSAYLSLYWASVPERAFTLELRGPKQRTVTVDPSVAASRGVTQQVVTLPLSADLPAGQYAVYLHDQTAAGTALGTLTLEALPGQSGAQEASIRYPVHAHLGETIELVGYDLDHMSARPGDTVNLTLYWRANAVVPVHYKVLAALMGQQFNPQTNNPLWAQIDSEPVNWTLPTSRWSPGQLVVDRRALAIDAAAPPGAYQLLVVMYGLTDGTRLQAYSAKGEALGDMVVLQSFEVR